ncbi:hypothetical protein Dimus_019864, partial [Dionaea muscipula]
QVPGFTHGLLVGLLHAGLQAATRWAASGLTFGPLLHAERLNCTLGLHTMLLAA